MGLFDTLKGPVFIKGDSEAEKQLAVLKSLPSTPEVEKEIKLVEAGIAGEKQIRYELENSHIPMYVIHDLFIEHDGLTAQIDYLIICRKCNYIIECKNLYGDIEIDNKGNFIRKFNYGKFYKKEGVYSPVTQNQRHLELFRAIQMDKGLFVKLASKMSFDDFWKAIVVFSNPKTIINDKFAPKDIKNKYIRSDRLVDYIKKCESESREMACSDSEMKESAEKWLSRNIQNPVDYTAKFSALTAEKDSAPVCKRCGTTMVKRIATKGEHIGEEFWGCSNFPKCRYTEKI